MKAVLSVISIFILMIAIISCGGNKETAENTQTDQTETNQVYINKLIKYILIRQLQIIQILILTLIQLNILMNIFKVQKKIL